MLPFPLAPVAATPSKHVTTFCPKCTRYDARVIPGGASVADARCEHCGGGVILASRKSAKVHAWARTFERAANAVVLAAAGRIPIEVAVEHAEYAAHVAHCQRLVPYGPEPKQ